MIRLILHVLAIVVLGGVLLQSADRFRDAYTNSPETMAAKAQSAAIVRAPAQVVETPEVKVGDLSAYAETVARPIFFDGRRYPAAVRPEPPAPPAATATAPAIRVSADGIKLLGVMIRGAEALALIEVSSQSPTWLGIGQKVENWTIRAIQSDSVRLGGNTESQFATLPLYDHVAAK